MSETGFSYSNPAVPEGYVCVTWRDRRKLWRGVPELPGHETLACAQKCVRPDRRRGLSPRTAPWSGGQRSDSIGWKGPGGPRGDDTTFWGYTGVPPEGRGVVEGPAAEPRGDEMSGSTTCATRCGCS